MSSRWQHSKSRACTGFVSDDAASSWQRYRSVHRVRAMFTLCLVVHTRTRSTSAHATYCNRVEAAILPPRYIHNALADPRTSTYRRTRAQQRCVLAADALRLERGDVALRCFELVNLWSPRIFPHSSACSSVAVACSRLWYHHDHVITPSKWYIRFSFVQIRQGDLIYLLFITLCLLWFGIGGCSDNPSLFFHS